MNSLKIAGLAALCLTVAACFHDEGDVPPLTADEIARADYARIIEEANILMFGDKLGYREGATTPDRVHVDCLGSICSVGFTAFLRANRGFNVENVELELMSGPNGVRMVVERASGDAADTHVLGGWMEYSLFASESDFLKHDLDPFQGTTTVSSYAVGNATGDNPSVAEGGAWWRGFVVGRDGSVADNLEAVVEGEASIFVDMGPDNLLADVAFTGLSNEHTQHDYDDMAWSDLTVTRGGFAHRDAVDDRITGQFFGPEQQEVAGVFERAGITGAFGGRQQ